MKSSVISPIAISVDENGQMGAFSALNSIQYSEKGIIPENNKGKQHYLPIIGQRSAKKTVLLTSLVKSTWISFTNTTFAKTPVITVTYVRFLTFLT